MQFKKRSLQPKVSLHSSKFNCVLKKPLLEVLTEILTVQFLSTHVAFTEFKGSILNITNKSSCWSPCKNSTALPSPKQTSWKQKQKEILHILCYLYCDTQSFLSTQLIFKCFHEHLQVLQIKSAETGRIQNTRQQVLSTVGISKTTCFPWKVC